MKIEEYLLRYGMPEDIDSSDLTDDVKFFLKNIPSNLRECARDYELLDTKIYLGGSSLFDEKTILKMACKNAIKIPFWLFKYRQAIIIDPIDEVVFLTKNSKMATYLSTELCVITSIFVTHQTYLVFKKLKERFRK